MPKTLKDLITCPCGRCVSSHISTFKEPCLSCSVVTWSNFKLKHPALETLDLFTFSKALDSRCPQCNAILSETIAISSQDWIPKVTGYHCRMCDFEESVEQHQKRVKYASKS